MRLVVPLGPFWDRHWLIFLSSKATAFIYLGDLKARGLVIVASCSTPNLTIRTNESCISLQLSDQSFFELYFDKFPWVEANLHWALPKSSMTQCFSNFSWIPIFKWRKRKDIVIRTALLSFGKPSPCFSSSFSCCLSDARRYMVLWTS